MGDRSQARIARSIDDVDRSICNVIAWHTHRTASDPNHQYEIPLRIVRTEVQESLKRLRPEYEALAVLDRGSVYEGCRRLDAILVFIGRLWSWYREKFDQRDSEHRKLLLASDEVVHSCYATAFPTVGARPSTEPLVYVETTATPDSARWHVPPEGVVPPPDGNVLARVLGDRIELLQIPTVRLPALARQEPWLLVLLAHEVGHHVHQGLGEPAWSTFGSGMASTAAAAVGPDVMKRWRGWGRELFADLFGVLACGPALIWAVSELELRTPAEMGSAAPGYPPPPVRWAVMAAALESAGLASLPSSVTNTLDASRRLPAEIAARIATDQRAVTAVVKALRLDPTKIDPTSIEPTKHEPPTAGPIAFGKLAGFSAAAHQRHGAVETWRYRLVGTGDPIPSGNRADARLCAAAGALEWAEQKTTQRADRERLADRVIDQLMACHEEGTRRAVAEPCPAARTFADDLLALPADQLKEAS